MEFISVRLFAEKYGISELNHGILQNQVLTNALKKKKNELNSQLIPVKI